MINYSLGVVDREKEIRRGRLSSQEDNMFPMPMNSQRAGIDQRQ